MERAWQIVPDPQALAARGITVAQLVDAVRSANGANGGSVIEQGEAELMVRSEGYLKSRTDFENVPITTNAGGVPVLLRDVARSEEHTSELQSLMRISYAVSCSHKQSPHNNYTSPTTLAPQSTHTQLPPFPMSSPTYSIQHSQHTGYII